MSVVVNDLALAFLLGSPAGPVGRDMERRGRNVEQDARQNAAGEIIGIETGDLISGIKASPPLAELGGPVVIVSTPARHRGFAYPTWHDRNGRPWLTRALASGFRRNV